MTTSSAWRISKTRAGRFDRVRREARAGDDQILGITEFFHPRIEEMAGLLPPWLGEKIETQRAIARLIDRGRKTAHHRAVGVPDAVLRGGPAAIPPPHAAACAARCAISTNGHSACAKFAASDVALATAVCEARRLVGGYSDTHSRGETKFDKVMQASERLAGRPDAAEWVQRLTKVALKDAEGR